MLQKGQQLGENTIISSLGNGNFGFVYKVLNCSNNTNEALKLCKSPEGHDDFRRFLNENSILFNLHPHENIILPVSDIKKDSGLTYYKMELADCNLDELLNQNTGISLKDKITIFKNICTGLKHAHKKGIVHRDLWWNNVLLLEKDNFNSIKLNDFGRGKDFSLNFSTLDGPCWGHLYVVPPEILFGVWNESSLKEYIISDLYSLGIILHYLINGIPDIYFLQLNLSIKSFLKQNNLDLKNKNYSERKKDYETWLDSIKTKPPFGLNISVFDTELNDDLNAIIGRLSNLNYSLRYKNIEEVLEDISKLKL